MIREVLRTVAGVGYSVSFTTRRMRAGEENGRDYFFVSRDEFEKLAEAGEFLEFALVHNNLYGTSRGQVERETSAGRDIILEIDVQGADSIKRVMPESVGVFILPPSYEVLRERLTGRQTESDEDLQLRLENARAEVRRYFEFDYVIINDEVTRAGLKLQSVIIAERCRRGRKDEAVQDILKTFENYKTEKAGD